MTANTDSPNETAGAEWAWRVVLNAHELVRSGEAPAVAAEFTSDAYGTLYRGGSQPGLGTLAWHPETGWEIGRGCPGPARGLLELYLPLCSLRPGFDQGDPR
jgi:hypothetical protein